MLARARRQNPPSPVPLLTMNSELGTLNSHREAVCIGCGCSDSHACVTGFTLDAPASGLQSCFWIKVDYERGVGVCSECADKVGEFEEKINTMRFLLFLANQKPVPAGKRKRRTA